MLNKNDLSKKIAYISINPTGKFVRSAQIGMMECGLSPRTMIHVSARSRIHRELRKYRMGTWSRFLLPKFKQHFGNSKSFSDHQINIEIDTTIKVPNLNSEETVNALKQRGIKYLVNCGAGIFRAKIINVPDLQIINAHAGKLPHYRNMNVVEWAVYNGDPIVGTVHLIDEGIDTGSILKEKELKISRKMDFDDVRKKAFHEVIRMVGGVILDLEEGRIKPEIQAPGGKRWYVMHPYFLNEISRRCGA